MTKRSSGRAKGAAGAGIKIPISLPALMARINRKLAAQEEPLILRASRSEQAKVQTGDYYTVARAVGVIHETDIDPAKLARDLGVLADFEYAEGFEDAPRSAKKGGR